MKNIQITIVFLLFSISLMAQNSPTGEERIESIHTVFEKEILDYTNIERKKHGLVPLKLDNSLSYAARYHAKDMATENYFEHDSYDRRNGRLKKSCTIFDRIEAFANYGYLAENISAGKTDPEDVVRGWMKSEGHRKNILNKNMTLLGVGYYESEDSEYTHYWVQNFGGE